jgi:hypothetical protein
MVIPLSSNTGTLIIRKRLNQNKPLYQPTRTKLATMAWYTVALPAVEEETPKNYSTAFDRQWSPVRSFAALEIKTPTKSMKAPKYRPTPGCTEMWKWNRRIKMGRDKGRELFRCPEFALPRRNLQRMREEEQCVATMSPEAWEFIGRFALALEDKRIQIRHNQVLRDRPARTSKSRQATTTPPGSPRHRGIFTAPTRATMWEDEDLDP